MTDPGSTSNRPQNAEYEAVELADLLIELQAIRALLEQAAQTVATCPHGATGVCMDCLTPLVNYHLTEAVNQITNEVWAAMRRG